VEQPHVASTGPKSVLQRLLRNFNVPSGTNAVPNRAVRVGYTQSYMSTPKAEQTTKSKGYPTPIKYLGLLAGKRWQACSTTRQK
jgi:hypothetical protein